MWGSFFYPHKVWVRDLTGRGGMGPTYSTEPGRELVAEVKDEQKLVRTASGEERVSSTTVTVPLDADVAAGALVTVWRGTSSERTARVLAVGRNDNGGSALDSFLLLSLE